MFGQGDILYMNFGNPQEFEQSFLLNFESICVHFKSNPFCAHVEQKDEHRIKACILNKRMGGIFLEQVR